MLTTHAAVRYMERVMGFDIDAIREQAALHGAPAGDGVIMTMLDVPIDQIERHVVTPVVRDAIEYGASRIKREYGELIIRNKRIVTVVKKARKSGRKERRFRRAER